MLEFIEVASTCISVGALIVGAVVSMVCISCSNVDKLPEISRTVHVTTVVPNSNEFGASLVIEIISVLSSDSINGKSNMLSV